MAENNKDRCPKEFLDKDWIYVNTITAKGGDPALFLKYCEMKKSATPEQLKTGIYGSVHPIVVEAKAGNVEIDVYRSWRSDNSSLAFQTQYGLVLTKLLQTGFLPEKMELSQNQEIVEKGERKNLKDKLTF